MASSTKTSKIPKKESESLEMTVTEEKPEKFDDEDTIKSEFDTLCRELNMDTGTADKAWNYYCETKHKYTLEGIQIHWLACALYVACRNSTLPTVGESGNLVQGNGVSLTRLLRSSKLALIEFFGKAQKWADMSNVKPEFRQKIDLLERNFAVSNVIFKKYQPIFVGLFKDPANDPPKVNRSRKQKKPPCLPGEVFEFTWGLFIRVKALCPDISDDLVNSYHLLLSCVDHIYACAFMDNRVDLLNEKFQGVSETVDAHGNKRYCVVDALCSRHDGIQKEVKYIREHWFRRRIKELFDSKVLKGDNDSLTGLLELGNFEYNVKSIRKEYEAYVLSIGEYDERVFLGDDADEDIGTPAKNMPVSTGSTASSIMSPEGLTKQIDNRKLIPMTPLSGKHLVKKSEKDSEQHLTPVSSSTQLVSRLLRLIGKHGNEPSEKLKDLFTTCERNPTEDIASRIKEMGQTFLTKYTTSNTGGHPGSHESIAKMRLRMGEILTYKILEAILFKEKAKNKAWNTLLEQDQFHRVLFACCLEIVIFCYNSISRTFPWLLNVFNLQDYHFYKVIEVIIRAEDWLPREVVKHLQRIEESILEWRAWVPESPVWDAISNDPNGVPSHEDVALPSSNNQITAVPDVLQSPLSHHRRGFIVNSPMAGDRFKSPIVTAMARRQLFDGPTLTHVVSPIKAGQSILASPQKPVVQSPTKYAIIQPNENVFIESEISRPKRTGGLSLFCRKVYNLAYIRLAHLMDGGCPYVHEEMFKRKVWTTFERAFKDHTHLFKGRHLDQNIMCCIYIVWKKENHKRGTKDEKIFNKIIDQYKKQPQAEKHVYERVHIDTGSAGSAAAPGVTPGTPQKLVPSNAGDGGEEKPNNLIQYYNKVFVKEMMSYMSQSEDKAPPLSPLPKVKPHPPQSPLRKVSDHHTVFIRPLKMTPSDEVMFNPQSPHKPLCYSFSRSPAKDLDKINALMRDEVERKSNVGKRLLTDDSNSDPNEQPPTAKRMLLLPPTAGGVNQKLGLIVHERTGSGE